MNPCPRCGGQLISNYGELSCLQCGTVPQEDVSHLIKVRRQFKDFRASVQTTPEERAIRNPKVYDLLAQGKNGREIAEELGVCLSRGRYLKARAKEGIL